MRLCKHHLVQDRLRLTHQRAQFRLSDPITQKHALIYAHLATDVLKPCFECVFICPDQAQRGFIQCRRFTAVDDTFLKSRLVQPMLICVGLDANAHNVLLAWAVAESERGTACEYFYNHLPRAPPQILDSTMITTVEKDPPQQTGFLARGHCCVHLKENFRKKFPDPPLLLFFWKITDWKTELPHDRDPQPTACVRPRTRRVGMSQWAMTCVTDQPRIIASPAMPTTPRDSETDRVPEHILDMTVRGAEQ